jgi:hypothetical protein
MTHISLAVNIFKRIIHTMNSPSTSSLTDLPKGNERGSMLKKPTAGLPRHAPLDDPAVRRALHQKVLQEHRRDPDTLVLNEMGVCQGYARVDVAVVNGLLHGYEIKSELDTLHRLARQADTYNGTLDRITLVTHPRHLEKAMGMIPTWWGVTVVQQGTRGGIHFKSLRRASINPQLNPYWIAAFLWRDEALAILESLGQARGLRGKPKAHLFRRLAEALTLDELRNEVRSVMKSRTNWQADQAPVQCGD